MSGGTEALSQAKARRVLITTDAVGGVWRYTIDLVRWLTSIGTDVLVACLGPAPSVQQRGQLPAGVVLEEGEFALEWSPDPWREVDEAGRWLLSLRSRFGPDLIHLNGYVHANLPWQCPVLVVAHSCVASWWRAVHGRECGSEWREYRTRVGQGLAAATAIVAPSQFMAGELTRHYQVAPDRVRVIYNFSAARIARSSRKQPICLAAGRVWDEAKNFNLLSSVAGAIPWPVQLAGSGEAAIPGPVRMLGHMNHTELLAEMGRARIFLHPALYEPFGLAVLEAARSGCCLVLSDIASLREIWGDAAVFAPGRDPEAWVKTIQGLIANPKECAEWGARAQARADLYNAAQCCRDYLQVYEALLAGALRDQEAAA